MTSPRVYSYLRFSDPKQAAGHSAERQMDYALRWASGHGMALDTSLTLRDEGLSAYHQRHVKQGALGAFLRAIDEERIAPGSVLVVEGLDRLSRAEPIQAQAQLAQIINAGITVVTASDGREYNREQLKKQPMDLVYSLLVMIRAHEESDTKSKRVKAAIRRQCQAWQAGTYRGIIRNGKDPGWVRWNGTAFELVQERAEAMRAVIDLYLRGYGNQRAMLELKAKGTDLGDLPTASATIYKLLQRKDLIGTKTLTVDGEVFELEAYYPPLVDTDTYTAIQVANNDRHRRKGKGEIPGIITGIGVTYCGYCGGAMQSQNMRNRPLKKDGTPQDGHRRLICHNVRCDVGGSCSAVPIERALLAHCSDKFNLAALCQGGEDPAAAARAGLSRAKKSVIEIERQLERVTAALLADDGATPLIIVRKARELEEQLEGARLAERQAEAEVARAGARNAPAKAEAWKKLVKGTLSLDYDTRMQARQLVAETFERIVVYHLGVEPSGAPMAPIDILLLAKGGTPRMLKIHRRSGELLEQEDGGG